MEKQELIIDKNEFILSQYLAKINLTGFRPETVEQYIFRVYLCQECFRAKKCKNCRCNPIDKVKESISCNKGIAPNLMSAADWDKFKTEHNIIIK